MEGRPDSSQVVEDPDFEFDEFVEDKSTPLSAAPPDKGELSGDQFDEIMGLLQENLRGQSYMFFALKSSLASLTSGPAIRAAVDEVTKTHVQCARELVSQSRSAAAVSLGADASLVKHAKDVATHMRDAQTRKNVDELADLFASLGQDEKACPHGTSEEIEHMAEQGTPLMLWAVGGADHVAGWPGQLLAQVNPKMQRLEISAFRFCPVVSAEEQRVFDVEPHSRQAARQMLQLHARFAVSRLLRAAIPIDQITSLTLVAHPRNKEFAALRITTSHAPTFESRRVHSNQASHNAWHAIGDFTAAKAASASGDHVVVGFLDALECLLGMLLATNDRLASAAPSASAPFQPPVASGSAKSAAESGAGAAAAAVAAKVALRAAGMDGMEVECSASEDESLPL